MVTQQSLNKKAKEFVERVLWESLLVNRVG